MHTISYLNVYDKEAKEYNSVQVKNLNDDSQLLKGTLKTSMPRLRNEAFNIRSDQNRAPTVDNEKTVSRNRFDTQELSTISKFSPFSIAGNFIDRLEDSTQKLHLTTSKLSLPSSIMTEIASG